jgi:hypothetical protein
VRASATLRYEHRNYTEATWVGDPQTLRRFRADDRATLETSLAVRLGAGLSLEAGYTLVANRSNVDRAVHPTDWGTLTYDRHLVQLTLGYRY